MEPLTRNQPQPRTPAGYHQVKVFEHNPRAPTVPGTNPIQIDVVSVPFQLTIPRRERVAARVVQEKTGKVADIRHSPNGDMTAVIVVESAVTSAPPDGQLLSDQAVAELLRSPLIRAELVRLARDPRVQQSLKK